MEDKKFELGIVGLGRMGASMAARLSKNGIQSAGFDLSDKARIEASSKGVPVFKSLPEMIESLVSPKKVWIMVPAGDITRQVMEELSEILSAGDIIIDGGNSFYKDTVSRQENLSSKGIYLLDAGTSGGIWGQEKGYCLMVGGDPDAYKTAENIFKVLAPEEGYMHTGPSGSGHFVKMIHNGIEYALLQAYAEGFEILKAKQEYDFDLEKISHLWNQGSVIRSWLLELAENAFSKDKGLENIKGYVEDSGEGRWTVSTAIEEDVPAPVITLSLLERFRSRQEESFSAKVIAALRNEFGGHSVRKQV